MNRAYILNLNSDGENIEVKLRLTLGSQLALKKKYNENALTTIFGALDDPEKMVAVFNQALNYKGNQNTIKNGEELYALIADNDLGGVTGFQQILSGIARQSGLLTEKEKEAIDNEGKKMFDEGNFERLQQSNK